MIRLGGLNGPSLAGDPWFQELRHQLFEYLRRPPEERAERRVPFDESFLYSASVREPVVRRSFGKCVFCECDQREGGMVDHFRPWRDARDLDGWVTPDFYAWLAYDLENLIMVCYECANAKGNTFPVLGDRAPYIATLPEIRRLETPMILDPYRDRPENELEFRVDGWCEPSSDRGMVTVSVIDLNRSSLIERRRKALRDLLGELELAADGGDPSVRRMFASELPFLGARLSILRQLLQGLTLGGQRFTGSVASLPRKLERVLLEVGNAERAKFRRRFDELLAEDQLRKRWDGQLPRVSIRHRSAGRFPVMMRRHGEISHIQIRDFKAIERIDLTIPGRKQSKAAACLMLLGENAVGKSSILQAVALALLGGVQSRRLRLDPTDYLANRTGNRWDQLAPTDAKVEVEFRHGGEAVGFEAQGTKIVGGERPNILVLGYGPRRYFDPKKSERANGAYARVQTLFRPTATIPYPGTWLNQLEPDVFNQVAQIIRIVLALSDDDELVRDMDGRICVNLEGRPVPLERLSEGYRSVFVMIADIVRELHPFYPVLEDAGAIVLIDEIETHLHPRWKMRVMSALRRALPNVQFIVTTHDPLCLRGMDDGEVVVLQRGPNGTVEMLEDLPSLKGMRADQLLTSDYFGLSSTVDPQGEIDMARYVAAMGDLPPGDAAQADQLVKHITIGDGAQEQVIHRAMRRFIAEREKPAGALRPDVSREAVEAVLAALKSHPLA